MTEALMIKTTGGLSPDGDAAIQAMSKLRSGSRVRVEFYDQSKPSEQQHRYIFVLLNTLFENQDAFADFDKFRQYVLIRLGYCDVFKSPDGPVAIAHSLEYRKMPADERAKLTNDIIDWAVNVRGFDRDALMAETRERAA